MVIYTLAIATAVYVALPVISFVLVKLMRIPMHQKGLYMFMTIFSNTGFMWYGWGHDNTISNDDHWGNLS